MKQITQSVFQIPLGAVNAFLVDNGGLTLVDTGMPGSTDKVLQAIGRSGRDPRTLQRIILTHAHTDHSGNAAELQQRLGIPVWAHGVDAELIEQGIAGRKPMSLSPGFVNWMVYQLFVKRASPAIAPVLIERRLVDGDRLPGGLRVIHTPGHSAGHISLLLEDERVLIAGDICANAGGLNWSVLYEDRELGRQSILRAAALDFDKAVFGHGGPLLQGANTKMADRFTSR